VNGRVAPARQAVLLPPSLADRALSSRVEIERT
jgi:hypothetical protein